MPQSLDFILPVGELQLPLRLYAAGALQWLAGQVLFITDPHFGKADHFRHAGIAIPTTILDHDLDRLSELLHQSGVSTLVILGDFFHSRHSHSASALATLAAWRVRHRNVSIVLVLGNHDQHAGPPPPELDIQVVVPPYRVGPFICHHMPQHQTTSGDDYVLAGHLHPYVVLFDRDGSRLRLASFVFGARQAVLPAFGGFTGGSHYPPSPNDRVFAVANGEIVEVPTRRPRTSRRA